ncbi:hypothetical protein OS493_014296 [Desmophyllum pertusum]|uniref:Uncharacterized protein n=1 Tax=Desmophyllum pertusum TaxID=174260 RepID=A0A9W9Z3R0_9CNID|nr:hypothetical protein OS493_014296 [Desmophyllum pertusum]
MANGNKKIKRHERHRESSEESEEHTKERIRENKQRRHRDEGKEMLNGAHRNDHRQSQRSIRLNEEDERRTHHRNGGHHSDRHRAQLPEHMFEHEAKRVQFCASLDRPKEEGLKCDHNQDHQQPGEAEEREKRENTDTTLHRHLQGTEDTDPDLQWREEIFHPPENHGNLPPLAEKRHGRKGGLRSLATDPDLQWREEVFHPHTHPPKITEISFP